MDKVFLVSSMDLSRIPTFLIWKATFLYGLIYSWGEITVFCNHFCVLVIFKEVVNTLKIDI